MGQDGKFSVLAQKSTNLFISRHQRVTLRGQFEHQGAKEKGFRAAIRKSTVAALLFGYPDTCSARARGLQPKVHRAGPGLAA